jgi:molybdopterin-guanine dinucleotide biosynthesis protein MobB
MNIVAVVGLSGVGKTRLIAQLVAEIKKRGLAVAVIKHCSRGFNLDLPGKDSWRFREAGADAVGLISPEETAVLQRKSAEAEDIRLASSVFSQMDIVLVEGRRADRQIPKLELVRKGVAERILTPLDELAAVVSDYEIEISRPVFHFRQVKEIVDFLETGPRVRRKSRLPRAERSRDDEKA